MTIKELNVENLQTLVGVDTEISDFLAYYEGVDLDTIEAFDMPEDAPKDISITISLHGETLDIGGKLLVVLLSACMIALRDNRVHLKLASITMHVPYEDLVERCDTYENFEGLIKDEVTGEYSLDLVTYVVIFNLNKKAIEKNLDTMRRNKKANTYVTTLLEPYREDVIDNLIGMLESRG